MSNIEPFNDEYFEHYAFFDNGQITKYEDSYNRFMGNANIPQVMLTLYETKFGKPEHYVDLGCGTGEEMAEYKAKGIGVVGCDFSPYVLNRKNAKVADFIHPIDSIQFMQKYAQKADIIFDSTLQYLDDNDRDTLLGLIKEKTADKCIFGILFDDSEREHPYRKQIHSTEEWANIAKKYGFEPASNILKGIFKSSLVEDAVKDMIFIKGLVKDN